MADKGPCQLCPFALGWTPHCTAGLAKTLRGPDAGMHWQAVRQPQSGSEPGPTRNPCSLNVNLLPCTAILTMPTQEPQALAVGIQEPAPGRNQFLSVKDCLTACDYAGDQCSGITVLSTVEPVEIGKTCSFVKANTRPGVYKRTMVRADLNRLTLPSMFLCPSGYQQSSGFTPCEPMSSPTVVVFSMTATGQCDESTINSVRTALHNFVSNPNNVFGKFGRVV